MGPEPHRHQEGAEDSDDDEGGQAAQDKAGGPVVHWAIRSVRPAATRQPLATNAAVAETVRAAGDRWPAELDPVGSAAPGLIGATFSSTTGGWATVQPTAPGVSGLIGVGLSGVGYWSDTGQV